MNEIVYKVMNRAAFTEAKAKGSFDGSAADRRDGFIHLSSVDQLEGRLCWEPSRGGAFFPHLFGALDFDALIWEEPPELGANGRRRLPLRVLP